MNEIAIVKELGEGSYGKVCLGKWRAARVALKFCKNKENLDEFINEVKLIWHANLNITKSWCNFLSCCVAT